MSDPGNISVSDYTYTLPDDRIAKFPLEQRDASKLLLYQSGNIEDQTFSQLPDLLKPNDLLVFNNTRVIHARLLFKKLTGSVIEIFCLEPADGKDPVLAFNEKNSSRWKALIGNAKSWKEAYQQLPVKISGEIVPLKAFMEDRGSDHFTVRFEWPGDHSFSAIMEAAGKLPIPPYLKRDTEDEDLERYQTVYAQFDGSVAAPTAGLHFTQRTFDDLRKKGVQTIQVTLHVGAGTFRPVKSETIGGHEMHSEKIYISRPSIEKILQNSFAGRIIVVGTTSMRTVESLYWFGVKLLTGGDERFQIEQWDPYSLEQNIAAADALQAILDFMQKNKLEVLSGTTSVLIAPGYRFHVVSGLITNFHQPNSTLLLLIAAFVGGDWKKIYDHALLNDYRFLSYGDSSILFRS